MKILQINAYYSYGSTGKIVQKLCTKSKFYEIDMYAIYWLKRNIDNESEHVIYCGSDQDRSTFSKVFEWVFDGGKISYNIKRTQIICDQIKKINPDIIHIHNLHGDFEYGSIDLSLFFNTLSLMNKKIIWTLHDCWPITGRCYHFQYSSCNKWMNECEKCPQKFFDREGILHDFSNINFHIKQKLYSEIKDLTIVTVSYWMENIVKKSILKNADIVTIYNGVNIKLYKPNTKTYKNDKTDNKKFRILCIGWDRKKGYQNYYKLSKKLMSNEEIVVIGNRPFFRKWKRLPNNIKILPYANTEKKMAALYNLANVYFNSSIAETFGLTTAESLACGIPVVGFKSTATPEIIGSDGLCGYTVDINDFNGIIKSIRKIKKQDEIKKKCRERAVNYFNEEHTIKKYFDLYELKYTT